MYGFLGLLSAELLTDNSSGAFFLEERLAIPNDSQFRDRLRSGRHEPPHHSRSTEWLAGETTHIAQNSRRGILSVIGINS